jgi:hypothetical protein
MNNTGNGFEPIVCHLTDIMKNAEPERMYRDLAAAGVIPAGNTDVLINQLCEAQLDVFELGWLPMYIRTIVAELQEKAYDFIYNEALVGLSIQGEPTHFTVAEKKAILNIVTLWTALNLNPYYNAKTHELQQQGASADMLSNMEYFRGVAERMMLLLALQFRALARSMKDERPTEEESTPPYGPVFDPERDDEEGPDEQRTTG